MHIKGGRTRKPPCPAPEPATPPVEPECTGPKPNLFNLHHKSIMRNIYVGCAVSALSGIAYYLMFSRPRRKAYKDFYANYDSEAAFQRMLEAGVFSAVDSSEAEEPKKK